MAALCARARCGNRKEGVGLRADQLVPLRPRSALDRGRSDFRSRAAGDVHRARCENGQAALELQYWRVDHRGADDVYRRRAAIHRACRVLERDRVCATGRELAMAMTCSSVGRNLSCALPLVALLFLSLTVSA